MIVWNSDFVDPDILVLFNRDTSHEIQPLHTHKFLELEYITSGEGVQIINGIEHVVKKGDAVFLREGDSHTYFSTNNLEVLNCIFLPSFLEKKTNQKNEDFILSAPTILHIPGENILEFEQIILTMEKEYIKKELNYQTMLKQLVPVLLILLARYSQMHCQTAFNSKIISFLENALSMNQSVYLKDVSRRFNFSPNYFSRYFKKSYGMTYSAYINNKRLEKAVELIIHTNNTIESICYQCGFREKKQFYSLFKKKMGTSPNSLRKPANVNKNKSS